MISLILLIVNRVTSIEFCESFELNSNLIEQLKLKMPTSRTIILHSMRIINNEINLTLDSGTCEFVVLLETIEEKSS
jgi:hypothetical protein